MAGPAHRRRSRNDCQRRILMCAVATSVNAGKPGTRRAFLPDHTLPRRRCPDQIQHVSNNPCRWIIGNHIPAVVSILVTRRRWRRTNPIRLGNNSNDVGARDSAARHKHRTLAAPPLICITSVVGVKPSTILTLKVIVVTILFCLSRRHMIIAFLLRLSWRHISMIMFLRLSRRYASMPWRRVVRILSRRTLCNAYGGGSQKNCT
jgi:hypothetical protein